MGLQQRAHRVGDLAAPAVGDRDVDDDAGPAGRALGGLLEDPGGVAGQQVERADDVERPAVLGPGEVGDDALDDAQQRAELGLGAGQVVGRQQPERDDLDAGVVAPAEQVDDLVGAALVAVVDARRPDHAGPAAVAVEHQPDVARHRRGLTGEAARQPALVQLVGDVAQPHATSCRSRRSHERIRPVQTRGAQRSGSSTAAHAASSAVSHAAKPAQVQHGAGTSPVVAPRLQRPPPCAPASRRRRPSARTTDSDRPQLTGRRCVVGVARAQAEQLDVARQVRPQAGPGGVRVGAAGARPTCGRRASGVPGAGPPRPSPSSRARSRPAQR